MPDHAAEPPKTPDTRRFGLYARRTYRSRGELVTVMFDADAAKAHAIELSRAHGYPVVEVKPFGPSDDIPEFIK